MKAFFGFAFFLLFLAALAFAVLKARQLSVDAPAAGGGAATGIVWRPTVIGAASMPEDSGMTLQINEDGQFSGSAGCNRYTGSLTTTNAGLEFSGIATTRMACPGEAMAREDAYLKALGEVRRMEPGNDRLQLMNADGVLLVEYVPAAEP